MTLRFQDLTREMQERYTSATSQTSIPVSKLLECGWLPPEVVAYRIREARKAGWDEHGAYTQEQAGKHAEHDRWPCTWCEREFTLRHPALPDPLAAEPPAPTLEDARKALDALCAIYKALEAFLETRGEGR